MPHDWDDYMDLMVDAREAWNRVAGTQPETVDDSNYKVGAALEALYQEVQLSLGRDPDEGDGLPDLPELLQEQVTWAATGLIRNLALRGMAASEIVVPLLGQLHRAMYWLGVRDGKEDRDGD